MKFSIRSLLAFVALAAVAMNALVYGGACVLLLKTVVITVLLVSISLAVVCGDVARRSSASVFSIFLGGGYLFLLQPVGYQLATANPVVNFISRIVQRPQAQVSAAPCGCLTGISLPPVSAVCVPVIQSPPMSPARHEIVSALAHSALIPFAWAGLILMGLLRRVSGCGGRAGSGRCFPARGPP